MPPFAPACADASVVDDDAVARGAAPALGVIAAVGTGAARLAAGFGDARDFSVFWTWSRVSMAHYFIEAPNIWGKLVI